MNRKVVRILSLFALLSLVSLACLSTPKLGDNNKSPAGETKTQASDKEEYVYEEGGFKFIPIPSWETNCAMGMIQINAPDAHPEYGPAFLMMAYDLDEERTTEEAFEKLKAEMDVMEVGKAKNVKVGGFPALQADLSTSMDDQEIKGIILTSMLSGKRTFMMMASAPAERWEKEVAPYYKTMLESIKFMSPKPGAGCPQESSPSAAQPSSFAGGTPVRQWARSATASSQYGDPNWAASQATGAPNVNTCEDSIYAWASELPDSKDWIELTYDTPVFPTEINIHISYNPSQVVEVQVIDILNKAHTVIKTQPEEVPYCPDVFQITLETTTETPVNKIKIMVDQSVLGLGWNEIDAVELVGYPAGGIEPPEQQTPAESQTASSETRSPYQPQDLDPGAFTYAVSGYEDAVVMNANVQYQSIDSEYVVGLISGDERYIISLFLPKDDLKKGFVEMKPYDTRVTPKGPTAAIYINAFLYIADEGEIDIQSDPASGNLSGSFYFKAHSKDFPDRMVEIAGAVNDVPLK